MRINRVIMYVFLSIFATAVFAQDVQMPDYSKWEKTFDRSFPCLLENKEVQVRFEQYGHYDNQEQTELSLVTVFHNPNTAKNWFAVYARLYRADLQKPDEIYLYDWTEMEDGHWIFVQKIPNADTLKSLWKLRYHLAEKEK